MNILFFHRWTGVRSGGTETHVKSLIKYFSAKHTVFLLTREGSQVLEIAKSFPNVQIFTVKKFWFENDHSYENPTLLYFYTAIYAFKAFFKLLWIIFRLKLRGEKIDVISVHFATEAVLANVIRFLFKTPYIFILEGYTAWEAKEAKKATNVVSISKYISAKCKKVFGYYPKVISLGEDKFLLLTKEELQKKINKNTKQVLTLCRLDPRKNLYTVLKTIEFVKNKLKRTDIKFIIGGTGILENDLKNKIKEYGIGDVVKMIGFVGEDKLRELYRNSDIYFLPTFEEGFGIVFMEAMKSGCAILSCNNSAVPEVVGDCGVLVDDAENYKEFANALVKLIDSVSFRKKLVTKGLVQAERFDWAKIIKEYEKEYKRTCSL